MIKNKKRKYRTIFASLLIKVGEIGRCIGAVVHELDDTDARLLRDLARRGVLWHVVEFAHGVWDLVAGRYVVSLAFVDLAKDLRTFRHRPELHQTGNDLDMLVHVVRNRVRQRAQVLRAARLVQPERKLGLQRLGDLRDTAFAQHHIATRTIGLKSNRASPVNNSINNRVFYDDRFLFVWFLF